MTTQQRIALRHPALVAEEVMHPRHHVETVLGTITVTVNTGYE